MKQHPVYVPRHKYRGGDVRKQAKAAAYNRIVEKVERHLRQAMEDMPAEDDIQMFISYTVAYAIEEPPELVRDIIYTIDAGANGVTLYKGDYEKAIGALRSR